MVASTNREGSDITVEDWLEDVKREKETSEIVEFFEGSTIFITGATGFLGRMFLEKLLRTCYRLKRIYILVRPKKGKDVKERFEGLFEGPNFDNLKRLRPHFRTQISLVSGDCSLPDVGLSEEDKARLISEVDCIIHCAATVRFDEPIKTATYINVRSVKDLVKMAKQMKRLRAMIHISTAFSNCVRQQIDETFYDPPISAEKLLTLIDCLDEDKLKPITSTLLGEFPNTYVYTKAVAESIVKEEGKNLPLGVYRPSIVIGSVKEPLAGWIDNLYGATGVLVGAALGVLRSLHGNKENLADMVPADYVVNGAIAALWDIATSKSLNVNKETQDCQNRDDKIEAPVYNFVSSPESPINWYEFTKLSEKHAKQVPSEHQVWHYFFALRSNPISHMIAVFLLHTIPAYIVDFLAVCIGRKPIMVKGYQKINKFMGVIGYFSMREWYFTNENVQQLWKKMKRSDRENFEFSMTDFDWDSYFYTYIRGGRQYLLKDPLETVPKCSTKYYTLMIAHYSLCAFILFLLYQLLSLLFYYFFTI